MRGKKHKNYLEIFVIGSFSCSLKSPLKCEDFQPSHFIYLCASGLHAEVISISGVLPHHTVCCYGNSSKHLQNLGCVLNMHLGKKGCVQRSKL